MANAEEKRRAHNSRSTFPCDVCNFTANSDEHLSRHLESNHRFQKVNNRRSGFSPEERRRNGICSFWNTSSCRFEELCRFSHEQIPQCHYDGFCRNNRCRFAYSKVNPHSPASSSPAFLDRRTLRGQWRQNGGPQRGMESRRKGEEMENQNIKIM